MKIGDAWIQFWYEKIGANIIPADTRLKRTHIAWGVYQDSPIPPEQIEVWERQGSFQNGMAVIAGKLWRGPFKDKYLIAIDCDNQVAINEICQRGTMNIPLLTLASRILVEQHKSNPDKAHIYLISDIPFPKKSSDRTAEQTEITKKLDAGEIPAIEIKGEGKHGIMYCTPSPHKKGDRYEIIGTLNPVVFNTQQAKEFMIHLDNICKKYGIQYLEKISQARATRELFEPTFKVREGNNRHEAVLRAADVYLINLAGLATEPMIKNLAWQWNNEHCEPPLSEHEFNRQWDCAKKFVETHIPDNRIQKMELPKIQRTLTKDLLDENVIIEGRVHAIEEIKQAITADIFECGECGVIYEENIKTCTVKSCRSQRIKRILSKDTLTDHRYIQLTLFAKDGQQEGEFGETRVWVSLYGKLAHTELVLSESIRVEGTVAVAKSNDKAVVSELLETFLYVKAKRLQPITDRKEIVDAITPEERTEMLEWAENSNVIAELNKMFAPHIYGQDLVKESILYQIVGAGYEGNINRGDIHILIIGDPSEGKTELSLAASRIAEGEYSSGESVSAAGIGAGLVHDKTTGRHVVEAGIAVKGNRKLKALDEIDKMPRVNLNQLLTIMDKGFYKLDKVKHSIFETIGPWLCTGNPKDGRYNEEESILSNIGFPQPVLTRFDLIYILKRSYEQEKTEQRLQRINAQYTNIKELENKEKFLRKYLKIAKESRPITIDNEVFKLLSEFYHKLESSAEKGKGGLPITERQYHGMLRMSIARARLHLRNQVIKQDAQRAIEIMSRMMVMAGVDPESGEVDLNVLAGKPASKKRKKEMANAFVQEIMGGEFTLNRTTNEEKVD